MESTETIDLATRIHAMELDLVAARRFVHEVREIVDPIKSASYRFPMHTIDNVRSALGRYDGEVPF